MGRYLTLYGQRTAWTLSNNNLTSLSVEAALVARLHALRLADNPIVCDCRVARLSAAVRAAGVMGVGAR
ncbi:unnamed protein product [Pieris macdunnoughi]|uniref:Uncharacterized protein n=1 Tax=Pieris macdunnoughi TaxID=345717 RepID=A0A821XAF0_9NEOP|nr:unnamed protein product [Pieris macdunnoughi]